MRASTCDKVSRLCVRPVCCWFAFPLVPALDSNRLRGGSLRLVRQLHSYYYWVRLPPFVHHRLSVFPSRCGPEAGLLWPNAGSPNFRRDPFARDLLFDPGRMGMASLSGPVHVAFDSLHGLRSCDDPLRGSITHPTQPLCTLRGRRRRRLTQHSLPGCLLGITWVGLSPTDRASLGWRLRRDGPQSDIFTDRRARARRDLPSLCDPHHTLCAEELC